MNLYLISQDVNNNYDTYDSAVVAALNEEDARKIHPCGDIFGVDRWDMYSWTSPENVKVEKIGRALKDSKQGAILSSFNAG